MEAQGSARDPRAGALDSKESLHELRLEEKVIAMQPSLGLVGKARSTNSSGSRGSSVFQVGRRLPSLFSSETRQILGGGMRMGDHPEDEDDDFDGLDVSEFEWRYDGLLRFADHRLERVFAKELSRRHLRMATFILLLSATFAAVHFLMARSHLLGESDAAARFLVVVQLGTAVLLTLAALALRARLVSPELAICFATLLLPPVLLLVSPFRVSTLFGVDPLLVCLNTSACEDARDDSVILLAMLVLCCTPAMATMHFTISCFGFLWANLMYAFFSLTGVGPHSVGRHGLILCLFAAHAAMLAGGSYRIEWELRAQWLESFKLRMRMRVQKQHLLQHQRWAKDLEERLAAAEAPDVSVEAPETKATSEGPEPRAEKVPPPMCPLNADLPPGQGAPNALLAAAMYGRSVDVERLRKMAQSIRKPAYGLREYFDDALATFPELSLFFANPEYTAASSGLSAETEYQRTVGALFAVYWLLRLPIGGKEGFCYGYGEDWQPKAPGLGEARREAFLREMEWEDMDKVATEALAGSEERLEAMLCLTAFHDIMKVPALCPTVAPEHAPYEGYGAGEVINDHDLALAYVLDRYPELLPSYRGLSEASRAVILFTQSKMHFNHGWFVQAEATPGAMLSKFKAVLGKAQPSDLAFYFFHWLTDLSGAEGRPLAGAEKFVLRFPRSVLSAFLWSIPFLQRLADPSQTEVSVVIRYLEARHKAAAPEVPLPQGFDAVARLRLEVMAQSGAPLVRQAWPLLPRRAQDTLRVELARTGIRDQRFVGASVAGGPALFVYYGPALLQHCTTVEEMSRALLTLAAIYRAGRGLWPQSAEDEGTTVTLEAGCVKAHAAGVLAGTLGDAVLLLERRGAMEGVVLLAAGGELNEFMLRGSAIRCLELRPGDWLPLSLSAEAVYDPSYTTRL